MVPAVNDYSESRIPAGHVVVSEHMETDGVKTRYSIFAGEIYEEVWTPETVDEMTFGGEVARTYTYIDYQATVRGWHDPSS